MDFHLMQWRDQQHESDQQQQPASEAEPAGNIPRMGGYLSLAQMQELELQALIYRHMVAGAAVPPELLQLVKNSLLLSYQHYFLQHHSQYPFYHQNWYWGRAVMDPEPGRCRRTDGKKWRCSRDVVAGQKYCERHVHRGRKRSRKPVEFPTSTSNATASVPKCSSAILGTGYDHHAGDESVGTAFARTSTTSSNGAHFSLSGAGAIESMFELNQGLSESTKDNKSFFESQQEASGYDKSDSSSSRVLRCFFDDYWPRSSDHDNESYLPTSSTVSACMSAPRNPSSDFLRLSTGSYIHEPHEGHPQLTNLWEGSSSNRVASLGGPLAEALRSSTTGSSLTSVLHQLQHGSAATDASFVSA